VFPQLKRALGFLGGTDLGASDHPEKFLWLRSQHPTGTEAVMSGDSFDRIVIGSAGEKAGVQAA
jgi:hypothetical protein